MKRQRVMVEAGAPASSHISSVPPCTALGYGRQPLIFVPSVPFRKPPLPPSSRSIGASFSLGVHAGGLCARDGRSVYCRHADSYQGTAGHNLLGQCCVPRGFQMMAHRGFFAVLTGLWRTQGLVLDDLITRIHRFLLDAFYSGLGSLWIQTLTK